MTAGEGVGEYASKCCLLSTTPPGEAKWGSLTLSTLKAMELANSTATTPGGALLLALKKEAARHRVANDQRSAVAVAPTKRRRGHDKVRRLLRSALERGQLTDSSYTLLMDLVVNDKTTSFTSSLSSWSTVDLDDLSIDDDDYGDENNVGTTALESDVLWQADAEYRKQQYKRRRLTKSKALGLGAGLDCHSPFDHQELESASTVVATRQLRPLHSPQVEADPNMPGFIRRLLNHHLLIKRTRRTCPESSAVRAAKAETCAQQQRCDLYRRLARALDQRAAPADRLFRTTTTTLQQTPPAAASGFAPNWLRPSVSKRMFSRGTNLFPKQRTALTAYDRSVF